ncbi:MAG: phosphatase [Rubrobacteraceae bacterium]|nr:phosphatase [Rubrobacteraceae bacterium]MDQ3251113.1 phosphatase [Actinomycetota bacterium]MDQ3437094.1 phosphatase [Actinomycetota bacterium]
MLNSGSVNPLLGQYAHRLSEAGVAGSRTSHSAENNLLKIGLLLDHDESNTFGMEDVLRDVGFEEAYDAVALQIGNPPDREENPGRGCIDPARTAAGLVEAGEQIGAVAGSGGRLIFATGHPGALILYYLGLAQWAQELGGEVLTVESRGLYERGVSLDWTESVAVLGDGASLFHTHDPEPMRDVLRQTGAVDLVVADHGFAGAAIAAGIPTIVVMDTNDPAFAVVAGRGADVIVVPMDDNRPLNTYSTALEVVRRGA